MYNQPYPPNQILNQFGPVIDNVYNQHIKKLVPLLPVPNEVKNLVYSTLTSTGYDLAMDYITKEVNSQGWNEPKIQNIICLVIEYVIAAEAAKLGYQINDLLESYNWVMGTIIEVQQYCQQMRQQSNQPYNYNQSVTTNYQTYQPGFQPASGYS